MGVAGKGGLKELFRAGAVRIAIVQSVRVEVTEFATAVGFEVSVEMLLGKIEDFQGKVDSGQPTARLLQNHAGQE